MKSKLSTIDRGFTLIRSPPVLVRPRGITRSSTFNLHSRDGGTSGHTIISLLAWSIPPCPCPGRAIPVLGELLISFFPIFPSFSFLPLQHILDHAVIHHVEDSDLLGVGIWLIIGGRSQVMSF